GGWGWGPGRGILLPAIKGGFGQVPRGGTADQHQSTLMFRALMRLPHFSVSWATTLPKSAGGPASTVPPRSASRALILASARPALISLLSLSTISAGVLRGAPMPVQKLPS